MSFSTRLALPIACNTQNAMIFLMLILLHILIHLCSTVVSLHRIQVFCMERWAFSVFQNFIPVKNNQSRCSSRKQKKENSYLEMSFKQIKYNIEVNKGFYLNDIRKSFFSFCLSIIEISKAFCLIWSITTCTLWTRQRVVKMTCNVMGLWVHFSPTL